MQDWEVLQTTIEYSLAAVAAGGGVGGALGLGRALWRWGGTFGADLDYRKDLLKAQVDLERAKAALEQASADRAMALRPATYSPHVSYAPHTTNPHQTGGVTASSGERNEAGTPFTVPTFHGLLNAGRVGRGAPLLFGFDGNGQEVTGSWLDLYSTACGGLPGSGKTWGAVSLLLQSVLWGARVAVIDPHAGDDESLTTRLSPLATTGCYLCEPASSSREILATVKLVNDELDRRMSEKAPQKRTPWIIAIDEFSSLMRGELEEPIARLVERIGQEARKFGLFALALGQNWTVSRAGGSELRDSLASAFVYRLRPAQARYLTGLTAAELPKDLLELPAGTSYLLSTRGELSRVATPRMQTTDVQHVATLLLTDDAPTMPRVTPEGSQEGASDETAPTAPESGKPLSAEAARVQALFLEGYDLAKIVYQVRGVRSNEGKRYQKALEEVTALLREAVQA